MPELLKPMARNSAPFTLPEGAATSRFMNIKSGFNILKGTVKEFGDGSGMGLVVVQSVVRNMFGGSIAVNSKVGVGTTVTVTLPIPPQRSMDPLR